MAPSILVCQLASEPRRILFFSCAGGNPNLRTGPKRQYPSFCATNKIISTSIHLARFARTLGTLLMLLHLLRSSVYPYLVRRCYHMLTIIAVLLRFAVYRLEEKVLNFLAISNSEFDLLWGCGCSFDLAGRHASTVILYCEYNASLDPICGDTVSCLVVSIFEEFDKRKAMIGPLQNRGLRWIEV